MVIELALINYMTVKQKDILRRVMEQYVIKEFPMFEIGIAQYLRDRRYGANPAIYGWGKPQID